MRMTWDLENGVTTVVLPQSSVLVEVGVRIFNNWLSAPLGSGLAVADVCSRKLMEAKKLVAPLGAPLIPPWVRRTHPTSEKKQLFDIFFEGWVYARMNKF